MVSILFIANIALPLTMALDIYYSSLTLRYYMRFLYFHGDVGPSLQNREA